MRLRSLPCCRCVHRGRVARTRGADGPQAGGEQGQVTIALVGVIAVAALFAVALGLVGEAIVHRARAHNAADAVALASVVDPGAASQVAAVFREAGVDVTRLGSGVVHATSGPSQAQSRASLVEKPRPGAPVVHAVIARAEQLTGRSVTPLVWESLAVVVDRDGADALRQVAHELGLCEEATTTSQAGVRFVLCG